MNCWKVCNHSKIEGTKSPLPSPREVQIIKPTLEEDMQLFKVKNEDFTIEKKFVTDLFLKQFHDYMFSVVENNKVVGFAFKGELYIRIEECPH